jgi:iron complex transport system substrate-binding protein
MASLKITGVIRIRRIKIVFFLTLLALVSASGVCEAVPKRILSLSPAATEILFDLGLGDNVVGVTEYCSWPPEVKSKTNVGDMMHVNMEVVVSLMPNLVLISNMNEHIKPQIEALGYPVTVVYQDDFGQICESMTRVGEACGISGAAKKRVSELRRAVKDFSVRARRSPQPRVLVVVGRDVGDSSFKKIYVAGELSFYQDLLAESGAKNAFEGRVPYAAISMEGLLRLDPDIIIELIGEHGMTNVGTPEIMSQWRGLSDVRAASLGNVAVIRGDFSFRAGPRYPLILESFASVIHDGIREISR